jgi:hypothetical protein
MKASDLTQNKLRKVDDSQKRYAEKPTASSQAEQKNLLVEYMKRGTPLFLAYYSTDTLDRRDRIISFPFSTETPRVFSLSFFFFPFFWLIKHSKGSRYRVLVSSHKGIHLRNRIHSPLS